MQILPSSLARLYLQINCSRENRISAECGRGQHPRRSHQCGLQKQGTSQPLYQTRIHIAPIRQIPHMLCVGTSDWQIIKHPLSLGTQDNSHPSGQDT